MPAPESAEHDDIKPPFDAATLEEIGFTARTTLKPTDFGKVRVAATTLLGRRKKQEDRLVICPRVFGLKDCSYFGVFDGTVGDHAAEFAHRHMMENTVLAKSFQEGLRVGRGGNWTKPETCDLIEAAVREGFAKTDRELIRFAATKGYDYTSCTAVTACVTGDLLTLGHVGDSRIVLGRERSGTLFGQLLTRDHKPDMPEELRRIHSAGGSLTYLHGGKPFIRGGDFAARQAKGERPMQLNYSRALGGKDLKPYGLSADPDVSQLQLTSKDKVLILASDGLWDVVDPDSAVRFAWDQHVRGEDPSDFLANYALRQHDLKGSVDNVTVLVVIF